MKRLMIIMPIAIFVIGLRSVGAPAQTQVLVLGAPERVAPGVLFGLPIDVALAPGGALLVADMYENVITKVAPDGVVLWQAGRDGAGPGEFRRLYRVACAVDGTVAAFDMTNQEVSRFSAEGEFIDRGRLDSRMAFVDRMVFLPNGNIAIAGIARNNHSIHVFDEELRLVDSFGPLPESNNPRALEYWGAGGINLAANGDLLFTLRVPYEIYRFSESGELQQKIVAPFSLPRGPDDNYVETRTETGYRISANTDFVVRPLPTHDLGGGWLLSGRLVQRGVTVWDLFRDGELIESLENPNRWRLATVDRARRVLVVQAETPEGDVEFLRVSYTIGATR